MTSPDPDPGAGALRTWRPARDAPAPAVRADARLGRGADTTGPRPLLRRLLGASRTAAASPPGRPEPGRGTDAPDRSDAVAVSVEGVTRTYGREPVVTALAGVDAGFVRGTATAVMGPSGSGKSTLLHCAAGLDRPTAGRVRIGGTDLSGLSETRLTELRRTRVGFVFQAFNLVGALTVEQNILLPLRLSGRRPDPGWLAEVVDRVGLGERMQHRPAQLSGGQQQRVAIARALATRPDVIFCDEPTGALDTQSAAEVLGLLRAAVDEAGQTVIMVTHDPVAASYADRVLVLADGRIVQDVPQPGVDRIAEQLALLGRRPDRRSARRPVQDREG